MARMVPERVCMPKPVCILHLATAEPAPPPTPTLPPSAPLAPSPRPPYPIVAPVSAYTVTCTLSTADGTCETLFPNLSAITKFVSNYKKRYCEAAGCAAAAIQLDSLTCTTRAGTPRLIRLTAQQGGRRSLLQAPARAYGLGVVVDAAAGNAAAGNAAALMRMQGADAFAGDSNAAAAGARMLQVSASGGNWGLEIVFQVRGATPPKQAALHM